MKVKFVLIDQDTHTVLVSEKPRNMPQYGIPNLYTFHKPGEPGNPIDGILYCVNVLGMPCDNLIGAIYHLP